MMEVLAGTSKDVGLSPSRGSHELLTWIVDALVPVEILTK